MNIAQVLIGAVLLTALAPAAANAEPLTIKAGESWLFAVEKGEPVRPRRINPSTSPGPGQIKATLLSALGTTLTMTNNSSVSYTFRAELLGGPAAKTGKARTCTLPANRSPVLEYWPVKAAAVRLSGFKLTSPDGNCP
jgi:hypothetical protein